MVGAIALPALAFWWLGARPPAPVRRDPAPLDLGRDPAQGPPELAPLAFTRGGMAITLTPLATYRLAGRVLHKADYAWDWNARLAPVDVAMAWGPMLEHGLYRKISWSQRDRWYFWRYGADLGRDDTFIARYSANTHLVPATARLAAAARALKPGDQAELSGHLVRVDATEGDRTYAWLSSTSREDTGDGSCELLYLTRLRRGDRVYE